MGLSFCGRFPCTSQIGPHSKVVTAIKISSRAYGMSRKTVALVNNEKSLRVSFAMAFERHFNVKQYSNTEDALELIEHPCDLAIMDCTNAPFGGLELFRRIRKKHSMPVIFMSAWASEAAEQLQAEGLSAEAYLDIPVSQRQVIDTIKKILATD